MIGDSTPLLVLSFILQTTDPAMAGSIRV